MAEVHACKGCGEATRGGDIRPDICSKCEASWINSDIDDLDDWIELMRRSKFVHGRTRSSLKWSPKFR